MVFQDLDSQPHLHLTTLNQLIHAQLTLKMIVNVSDHITGVSGSMRDVMKKIPGIMVINNKISMAGNQNVTILIDGRPTQYLDMQTLLLYLF